jgi:hypothetical protein
MSGNKGNENSSKNSLKNYYCEHCDYSTSQKQDFMKHNLTRKHAGRVLGNKMNNKEIANSSSDHITSECWCVCCDYRTFLKSDFIKHQNSMKHKNAVKRMNPDFKNEKSENKLQCDICDAVFMTASGIWKHKQKCKRVETRTFVPQQYEEPEPKIVLEKPDQNASTAMVCEMFMEMMKTNKDMQNLFMEQHNSLIDQNNKLFELAKKNTETPSMMNSNNTNSNNTNNQFNLNFFLNETCKDAINLTDFVNSLKLQVKDFETTGRIGYVEGISRIIVNGLKQMDVSKRPLHCTDIKRETVYVKDKDLWEKENPEKNKLKSAVNRVAQMNFNQLKKWQEMNPDCVNINTKENDEYIHLSLVALGGNSQEEEEKYMEKIMKNVLKEVVVDKIK